LRVGNNRGAMRTQQELVHRFHETDHLVGIHESVDIL
jgi:hypothetical protein